MEPLRVNLSANLPPCARTTTLSLRAFIPHACFCFALVCLHWFACFGWDLLGTRTRTPWAYSSGRIFPPRTARRPLAQRCETTSILACLGMSTYVSVPSPTQHDSSHTTADNPRPTIPLSSVPSPTHTIPEPTPFLRANVERRRHKAYDTWSAEMELGVRARRGHPSIVQWQTFNEVHTFF